MCRDQDRRQWAPGPTGSTARLVDAVLRREIAGRAAADLVGVSCLADGADALIAVWGGQPGRGFGGTADVVAAAMSRGVVVTTIWPAGASRE